MPNIRCELVCDSISTHIDQLYAGFCCLERQGIISLTQRATQRNVSADRPPHFKNPRPAHLTAVLNGTIKIYYDTYDSWEIDEEALAEADWYFKRSFAPEQLTRYGKAAGKVHPLGLNYAVCADGGDRFALQRAWMVEKDPKRKLIALVRATAMADRFVFTPRMRFMQALPELRATPRILFMARAWDPHDDPARSPAKIRERAELNEMRANCVRALRREFRDNFFGGFAHTEFGQRHYGDVLLPTKQVAQQRKYLELLRAYPICVATTGLHGSIGWKLGEYVSFAKAVLSEPLQYQVTGDLRSGQNYLEFSSMEDCIRQAHALYEDSALRISMMLHNARYYHAYLRPDMLVLNSLAQALAASA